MAYPLLLAASAALSAGGTVANIAGNEAAASKMQQVRTQALARQKGYQDRAQQVFGKSVSRSTEDATARVQRKGAAARMKLADELEKASAPVAAPLPTTAATGTNGVTDGTLAGAQNRQQVANTAWSRLNNESTARMGSYEDAQLDQNLNNARAGQDLSVISNQARGDANLLPAQLEAASHAGDSLKGWGSLVSALGSLGMMGAAVAPATAAGNTVSAAGQAAAGEAAAAGYAPTGFWATKLATSPWSRLALTPAP